MIIFDTNQKKRMQTVCGNSIFNIVRLFMVVRCKEYNISE